jgi:hypothetical protein
MVRYRAALAGLVIGAICLAVPDALSAAKESRYTLKEAELPPPKELREAIRDQLLPKAYQVYDGEGKLFCEIWLARSASGKATPAQVQNGLTYQELLQTVLVGAVRFSQPAQDYRKQDIKPGIYTLRFAVQPQDGDHMGTAPHPEFCLLVSAALDEKPGLMEPKHLNDLSARSLEGGHPGVLLLFPNRQPNAAARVADHGMGHWALHATIQVEVDGKKVPLGIAINLVGHSAAA